MMLGHLGHIEWGDAVMRAIERVVAELLVYRCGPLSQALATQRVKP